MALPLISGLKADIVPHQEWAFRRWFSASGMRYYHRPRGSRMNVRTDGDFYQRVDPQLREACRLLHACGVQTTPSCQGHFHGREYFMARWEELTREAEQIRDTGLAVMDSESERRYLFRAPGYQLPWPDFTTFYRHSLRHQPMGYLGFIVPWPAQALHTRLQSALGELSDPRLHIAQTEERRLGGYLHHIRLQPRDSDEGARYWQSVTDRLRELLGREHKTR